MSYTFALIGAGIAGICIALEPVINSGLGRVVGLRLAILHSFLVGFALMVIINAFAGGFREYRDILKAPPYLWFAGIVGAAIVYLGAKASQTIGIASTLTIMVSVQLVVSVLIDSLGLFGAARVPVDPGKIVGVVLIIIAVKLIVK